MVQVGSQEWMDQQEKLDRINLQAHQSAQSRTDEFVMEAVVSSAKISLLLHQLLVIEVQNSCALQLKPKNISSWLDGKCAQEQPFILYRAGVEREGP